MKISENKLPMQNPRQKIFAGHRFGLWVVQEKAESRVSQKGYSKAYYLCKCDCGKIKEVAGNNLLYGQSLSCGCSSFKNRKLKHIERTPTAYRLYSTYRWGARKRNLLFTIGLDEFLQICKMDCSYCGLPPSNINKATNGGDDFIYNGIDRVDNTIGYVNGNCAPCCRRCNIAKATITEKSYYEFIKRSYDNLKAKGKIDG